LSRGWPWPACSPVAPRSRQALSAYHYHPLHLETRAVVDPLIAEHWIADYEV